MITIPVEAPVTEYLHNKASRLGIPLNGTFELTPCCNMACRMCYVRLTKEEQESRHPLRTAEEWIALAREAKEQGLLYLLLTGGEPFLHPEFRQIYTALHREGFLISINSNGTLIDEETIDWLRHIPPVRINLTLYGASDETYGQLCGNPHGFTQATRAIRLLRAAGISVKINCSLTPQNAQDLDGIFDYARSEGLIVQATSYMFPPLRRDLTKVGENDRFTPSEAAYQSARIVCQLNGEDAFLKTMAENAPIALPGDTGEDCPDVEGEGLRCRAGKCSFWITWDGRILPCGMLPSEDGISLADIGFTQAWKIVRERTSAIRLPGPCKDCAARDQCKACAAMVYTETGNFYTVPRYRCDMTKAYLGQCRRLEQEILSHRAKP